MKQQSMPRYPMPMPKREAGAGRGFVNPRRVDESEEDYITPEKRYQMSKDLIESREAEATQKAYDKATGMKGGGYVKAADGCAQRGKTRGTMV